MASHRTTCTDLLVLAEQYALLVEAGRTGTFSGGFMADVDSVTDSIGNLDDHLMHHFLILVGRALQARGLRASSDSFVFDAVLAANSQSDWEFVRANIGEAREAVPRLIASRARAVADVQLAVVESRMHYHLWDTGAGLRLAEGFRDDRDSYLQHLGLAVYGLWMLRHGNQRGAVRALCESSVVLGSYESSNPRERRSVLSWIPPQIALYDAVREVGVAATVCDEFSSVIWRIASGSEWLVWAPSALESADQVIDEIRSYNDDIYGGW